MNTKTQNSLNEVFNVDPIPDDALKPKRATGRDLIAEDDIPSDQLVPLTDPQIDAEDQQIKNDITDDYIDVRDNLRSIISQGDQLLDLAIQVAMGSQDSKSIDSATKLIGQMANLNSQLLDLTSKKQDVIIKTRPKQSSKFAGAGEDPQSVIGSVTNNTMFVGSPTDLLNMLKQQQADGVIDVNNLTENKDNA